MVQSSLVDRAKAQLSAFEFEAVGVESPELSQGFFTTLDKLVDEASELQLDEIQGLLQDFVTTGRREEKAEDFDLCRFVFEALQQLDVRAYLGAQWARGISIEALRKEFYQRARTVLIRYNDMLELPGDLRGNVEFRKLREVIGALKWEAGSLQVPGPLALRFWNLGGGGDKEIIRQALWQIDYFEKLESGQKPL